MPYRNVRGVNKGVQDEEELQKIKEEEKKKKKEKAQKWCGMIGMTVLEFFLCLVCLGLASAYYFTIESYRNANSIRHNLHSVRFILLPPTPLAIAGVFLTLTYIDLISWQSLRPITYFGWIMVATGGFLLFLLYAGVILLSTNAVIAIIAVVFGCITAVVFLADLICMLLTQKRFPVPYWILKRKYDKLDQCVCTGDRDLEEEEEVERPICRCGDHWGEPCTCDDPDTTCGCGADKRGKPPCECCECAAQVLVEQDADGTITYGSKDDSRSLMVDSMAGQDFIEERRKTTLIQADFPMGEPCTHRTPGVYCVDGLPQYSTGRPSIAADTYSVNRAISQISRKTAGTQSQMTVGKISPSMHRSAVIKPEGLGSPSTMSTARYTSPSRMNYNALASPSTANHMASRSMASHMTSPSTTRHLASPSTASRMMSPSRTANPVSLTSPSTARGLAPPPPELAARIGSPHAELSQKLGSPSMMMASRIAINKPQKHAPSHHRPQQMTYPVYTTTVDDHESLQKSIASKYVCQKKELPHSSKTVMKKSAFRPEIQVVSRSSTDDEAGEGDFSRKRAASYENNQEEILRLSHDCKVKQERARLRFSTFTKTDSTLFAESEGGYTSDPETAQGLKRIYLLPGQVSSHDDSQTHTTYFRTKKNVSVSARERSTKRASSKLGPPKDDYMRPRTSIEVLSAPRVIRNVSTAVTAVRTLSRVIEADNESRTVSQSDGNRESDMFPSECTITINKGHHPTEK